MFTLIVWLYSLLAKRVMIVLSKTKEPEERLIHDNYVVETLRRDDEDGLHVKGFDDYIYCILPGNKAKMTRDSQEDRRHKKECGLRDQPGPVCTWWYMKDWLSLRREYKHKLRLARRKSKREKIEAKRASLVKKKDLPAIEANWVVDDL